MAQSAQLDSLLYQPQTALRLHYPTEVDKRQPSEITRRRARSLIITSRRRQNEVTLDIIDAQGKVVRHLRAAEKKKNDQPPE